MYQIWEKRLSDAYIWVKISSRGEGWGEGLSFQFGEHCLENPIQVFDDLIELDD
jgi:hypothetical protein